MGLGTWGMGIGDLGHGEPETAEAAEVGLSPVDVLLLCLGRCWGEKSHLGLLGYKASCAKLPFGEGSQWKVLSQRCWNSLLELTCSH